VEGLKKPTKILVGMAGVSAEIRTRHLPNKSLKYYDCTSLLIISLLYLTSHDLLSFLMVTHFSSLNSNTECDALFI